MIHRATMWRIDTSDHGTFSSFVLDGSLFLWTAEPPWRNNKDFESCIPCGQYNVVPHVSPSRGDCFLLMDVPDRDHVLFHPGNYAGDEEKGMKAETDACILPGRSVGRMGGQKVVRDSRLAMGDIKKFAPEGFLLDIRSSIEEQFIVSN